MRSGVSGGILRRCDSFESKTLPSGHGKVFYWLITLGKVATLLISQQKLNQSGDHLLFSLLGIGAVLL
jgi:hypothetical protein